MKKILSAGVNAPSAMNTQPWHFTAVTDIETNEKLANAMGSMMPHSMPEGMEGQDFSARPEDHTGTITSATTRNDFNEVVTIIKQ